MELYGVVGNAGAEAAAKDTIVYVRDYAQAQARALRGESLPLPEAKKQLMEELIFQSQLWLFLSPSHLFNITVQFLQLQATTQTS